jgi:hypothetical protein
MPKQRKLFVVLVSVLALLVTSQRAQAGPIVMCGGAGPPANADFTGSSTARTIDSVPAYTWYHGCGPTAAASVIGFWDLFGFPNLFDAAGGDVFLTANVQNHISSPAHNAKYDPTPDVPGPVPTFTSVADWFQTSVDPLDFGWSFLTFADSAFEGYAAFRGYEFDAQTTGFGALTWENLVAAIDANRPFMSLVDVDGNGSTDHFVPVLGYDDRGALGRFYGSYTTWSEDETINWQPFRGLGNHWGIGFATFVEPLNLPTPTPVPEPGSLLLVIAGWGSLVVVRVRRR